MTCALATGDRVFDPVERRALDSQRRGIVFSFRFDIGSHQSQRFEDASHRAFRERAVADQSGLERLAREEAREETHGGAGIAAIDRAVRSDKAAALPVHDEHFGLGLFNRDPERAHRGDGVHAIGAAGKTAQNTGTIGEGSDEDGAMGNALVARDGDLGFEPCRALYPNVIHGMRGPARGRREESQVARKCPAQPRARRARSFSDRPARESKPPRQGTRKILFV